MSESQHPTDQELHDEIHRKLYREPRLDSSHIKVTVNNRNVLLTGDVLTGQEKILAENLVKDIPEIWQVKNELTF